MKFIPIFCLFICLFACKTDPKNAENGETDAVHASAANLEGNWIASSYVSRIVENMSVLKAMNNDHQPFSVAFAFSKAKPDSVYVSNGKESFSLAVKFSLDTIELKNAVEGKSIFLVYASGTDKSITMYDATGAKTYLERFTKTRDATVQNLQSFLTAMNYQIFAGSFSLVGKKEPVVFAPGGLVSGLPDYQTYQPCLRGDCFVAGQTMDVVYMTDPKTQKGDWLGWRFSTQKDSLLLYNLVNAAPDQKAGYKIGGVKYSLLRQAAPVKEEKAVPAK